MPLPYNETWTGTNGNAWSADWTTSATTAGTVEIQSNTGRMTTGTNTAYGGYARALLADQGAADVDIRVDLLAQQQAEMYPNLSFRTDRVWNTGGSPVWPQNGYGLEIKIDLTAGNGSWNIESVAANTRTPVPSGSATYTITNGDTVHLRLTASGTTVNFRIWRNLESEPSTPTFTFTDSTHTSRTGMGLGVNGGGGSGYQTSWEDLSVTVPAPTPVVPAWKANGTAQESITGITVPWPTHAIGDVALLIVESTGGQPATLSNANGFVTVTGSPSATGATTAGTQVTMWWCRATSTGMFSPVVADPGDHVYGVIVTFTSCAIDGNPWDTTATAVKAGASTSMSMPAVTTTVDNCLIVNVASRDNDSAAAAASAEANASLTGLTERFDLGTALGNGGGLMVWTGTKSAAGSSGNTTATVTSSINAYMTVALRPTPNRWPRTMFHQLMR